MKIETRREWESPPVGSALSSRKFFPSPRETIIVIHTNNTSTSFSYEALSTGVGNKITELEAGNVAALSSPPDQKIESSSDENIAAIKIQASFRGHLARQAFRALRSLVKLQAVVRGVCVRRQARIALHCMHALARLQVTVRARQLLSRCSE
ncbi:hypothetical protein F0562_006824 [Nyssa sinensis]|uniref:DUF4005 domain-containing protein n=1 Tax=Nyssa sinensis TaxID=561372 RepID=A0A5J5ALS5_9ASTE|nr:hypothetical protein F0562_006824 [Nyssa sinensis]